MIASIICYLLIGALLGVIFTLLYINFDDTWKKVVSSLSSLGGTGGIIFCANEFFQIEDSTVKFVTVASLILAFLISFIGMMALMCKLIKDKDDDDILRIRDILLGQKSYIDKYYEGRKKEIDAKLGIPFLEQRENQIRQKEESLNSREKLVSEEEQKIKELAKKKLKITLPEKREIVVNDRFLTAIPSYILDFSKCINMIKFLSESFVEDNEVQNVDLDGISSYLLSIASCISTYMFGSNNDVRVHFRYYDENNQSFEKLVAVTGKDIKDGKMTSIPYDKTSMIMKSFECKRCLIKSVNSEYDYPSNNYTKWKDYMTFAFYNLTRNGIPYLSLGISVKNATRYQEIFYFLGFVEIETSINEYIESVAQKVNFEKVLYGKGE